jgi:hypothetical protein
MDQNLARRWAAELRSGSYVRGKGKLTQIVDGIDYDCCLGVACKMYVRDVDPDYPRRIRRPLAIGIVVEYGDATHGGSHTMNIPGAVQQWLGARNVSGAIQHVFMAAHPHVDSGEHVLQRSDDWKRVEKVMGDANRPYDQHRYMPLKLTSLNDDGFTFAQIADVIEYFWDCI